MLVPLSPRSLILHITPISKSPIPFAQNITNDQAYELSILTGTQVLLLVVSETGLVYTFTTTKLQPLVQKPEGKNLIQVRSIPFALASVILSLLLALASTSLPYYIFISYSYSCIHSYPFSHSCRTAVLSPPGSLARTCFASPRKSLTSGLPQRTRRFRP